MKKGIVLSGLLLISFFVRAQKIFSEGTVTYEIKVETGSSEPKMADMFDGATATLFLKGGKSRYEMISALGTSITVQDAKTGNGAVIREYGEQKLLIRMNSANWQQRNLKYEGIAFDITSETKTIAGFNCKKAIARLKDGTSFLVYFTTDIIPENKEYDLSFRGLNGMPVEYESQIGKVTVKYTLVKINFDPVPSSRFDIPKSGYRELTYEESIKGR